MSKTIRSDSRGFETMRDDVSDHRTLKARGKSRPAGRMRSIIDEHLKDIGAEDLVTAR